jgi:hypothetical protein
VQPQEKLREGINERPDARGTLRERSSFCYHYAISFVNRKGGLLPALVETRGRAGRSADLPPLFALMAHLLLGAGRRAIAISATASWYDHVMVEDGIDINPSGTVCLQNKLEFVTRDGAHHESSVHRR